jgi:hypothetical protein
MKKTILTILASFLLSSTAYAGSFGVGVTGSYMNVEASGTETEGTAADTSTRKATVDNDVFIGSIYAEYSFDDASYAGEGNGLTIGYQITPGSADVSDKVKTRVDTITKDAAKPGAGETTFKANAEIDNYTNIYAEIPVWGSLYARAGMSSIDVITKDTSTTNDTKASGTYGNTSLDGVNLGVGIKGLTSGGLHWKLAYEQTDFDTLKLTSTTTTNSISADLDTQAIAVSLGYRF